MNESQNAFRHSICGEIAKVFLIKLYCFRNKIKQKKPIRFPERALSLCYRRNYYDTESELYYLQSRYYDPEIGRFINADAIPSIISKQWLTRQKSQPLIILAGRNTLDTVLLIILDENKK